MTDRLPPQSIESEMSLLGAIMLDKDAMMKVVDFLLPQDFYRKTHRAVYQAMLELFQKGEPIDLLSVSSRLKEKGEHEEVGGNSYLTELMNTVPTATHVASYARTVQKKRILRDLISAAQDISALGYNEEEDPEVLLDQAEAKIFGITQQSLSPTFVPVKAALEEAFERLDMLSKHGGGIRGIPSGFRDLDNMLSGLQKSDLVILAARPSLGKTGLAMNIACHAAMQANIPVGVFSLEMSRDQLVDRLISARAKVDLWRLRTGRLSSQGQETDFERIQQALGSLSESPVYIDDSSSQTVLQMRAMARRLQAQHGLGLIIVDYLQLIMPHNTQSSPVQQVTEISRALKGLARELNVPVLALSQLSRAVEQRTPQRPRLSDLRDSGSIEQDADVVMFIYREDKYRADPSNKNIAEIIIAKHRNGPVGSIKLFFDEQTASFADLAKDMDASQEEISGESVPF
ncbi:MAG: replicative DNA helicase [bacterium]|nr:replicative DNA helicase [bacterium]